MIETSLPDEPGVHVNELTDGGDSASVDPCCVHSMLTQPQPWSGDSMTSNHFLSLQLPLVGPPGPLMDDDKQQLHFASLSQALSGFPLFFAALGEERSRARAVERVMVVCRAHHLSFTHFTRWWSVHFAAWMLYLQSRFAPIFTMVSIWLCIKLTLEFKCDHVSLTLLSWMR